MLYKYKRVSMCEIYRIGGKEDETLFEIRPSTQKHRGQANEAGKQVAKAILEQRRKKHGHRPIPIIILLILSILSVSASGAGMCKSNTSTENITLYQDVDYSSLSSIVSNVTNSTMTDRENCIALWRFMHETMQHDKAPVHDWETSITYTLAGKISYMCGIRESPSIALYDPLLLLTKYQRGLCCQHAVALESLFNEAGYRARTWWLSGHVVTEVYYENNWHVSDANHKIFYSCPTGEVASVQDIINNPNIVSSVEDPVGCDAQFIATLYTTTENNRIHERMERSGLMKIVDWIDNLVEQPIRGIYA
jgi:hypothetical protein